MAKIRTYFSTFFDLNFGSIFCRQKRVKKLTKMDPKRGPKIDKKRIRISPKSRFFPKNRSFLRGQKNLKNLDPKKDDFGAGFWVIFRTIFGPSFLIKNFDKKIDKIGPKNRHFFRPNFETKKIEAVDVELERGFENDETKWQTKIAKILVLRGILKDFKNSNPRKRVKNF